MLRRYGTKDNASEGSPGMLTIGTFVLVLGLLVFVHEFGHFLMAKRAGVRVETFSFGFGPRIVGWRRGETDYRISALPLGGFVKMTGENPADEDAASTHSFAAKPLLTRMKIVLAGPLMNLVLPFFLMPIVYLLGIEEPAYLGKPPVVGWVEEGSPAQSAGFQPGDRIVSIQNEPVATWEKAKIVFASNPGKQLTVEVLRGGAAVRLAIKPESRGASGGSTGFLPEMRPVIDAVDPSLPAAKAGLRKGDEVLAIQNEPIIHWAQMAGIIRSHPNEPLAFTIRRGKETFTVTIRPQAQQESGVGILGITYLEETLVKRYGLLRSIQSGARDVINSLMLTFYVLGKFFTGTLSIKTLGGPILIAKMTGDAAQVGAASLISFVAFLSLQLGIINLLPIPVLDGGHMLFFSIEAILRRPLNVKIREAAQQVGFIVLVLFILVISYNDIMRILPFHIDKLFK